MMGKKARNAAPLSNISLEDLVPQDHLYRHLDQKLDLSFVREFVQKTYAQGDRPSIDPMVFFKLQLVMFFEGIRSERELMRQAADRLSVLWYLGYNLNESLPDHSSLTRIRTRYGVEVFRRVFETIVVSKQGLFGEKNCMLTRPKSKRMLLSPLSSHALLSKLILKISLLQERPRSRKMTLRCSNVMVLPQTYLPLLGQSECLSQRPHREKAM
jgi:transposase